MGYLGGMRVEHPLRGYQLLPPPIYWCGKKHVISENFSESPFPAFTFVFARLTDNHEVIQVSGYLFGHLIALLTQFLQGVLA